MKIPKNAKRVFKGVIFDVYQWQQKMFDGSYETFEMLKRVNTIEVIAVKDKKICISEQSQPTKKDFFSLFGGRAEKGEQPLATAKRELLEESGLKSNDWELIQTYEPHHKIDWQIYLFIARDCQKVAKQNLDAGEKIKVAEVNFDKFYQMTQSDKFWGKDLANDLFRIKNNKKKLAEFKQKLFK